MPRVDGTREDSWVRPVIDIELRIPGKDAIPLKALVDTGADHNMIPIQLGEAFAGKPFDEIGPIVGYSIGLSGTRVPFRILPGATMTYEGRTFARRVMVADVPRVLVGRSDFLERFDVRFYWGHKPEYMMIEPVQPKGRGTPTARTPINPTIRPNKNKPKRK